MEKIRIQDKHTGSAILLENMPFGIRVANLLPDPDTGWMWITFCSIDPDSRRIWCTKKDYGKIDVFSRSWTSFIAAPGEIFSIFLREMKIMA
jgi:hypothetical protein